MIPSKFAHFSRAQAERDRQHEQCFEPSVRGRIGVESECRAAERVVPPPLPAGHGPGARPRGSPVLAS
jgi:hypothetical protein